MTQPEEQLMHSNDSFPLCLHRHMHAKKIGFHEEKKWPVLTLGKCLEDFFYNQNGPRLPPGEGHFSIVELYTSPKT